MTTRQEDEDFEDALRKTRMNLIQAIGVVAHGERSAASLSELAEAYAWVVQPAQSHGSSRRKA